MNFKYLSFTFFTDILSFSITCFALFSLLTVIYTYYLVLKKGKDDAMNDQQFKEQHLYLFDEIRTRDYSQVFHYGFFLLRRILFVIVGFLLMDNPNYPLVLGLFTILFINWVSQVYFFNWQPLKYRFDRRLEMINEVLIFWCCLTLLTLTPWNSSPDELFLYSWLLILQIQIMITLNLLVVTFMIIKALFIIFIKARRLLKARLKGKFGRKSSEVS